MPVINSGNVLAGQNEYPVYPQWIETYQVDPAYTGGPIPVGTVVKLETIATGTITGDGSYTPAYVTPTTTTATFTMFGVVVGGSTLGSSAAPAAVSGVAIGAGQIAMVCVHGVCQILFDANNTTSGHLALQSTTTAGSATDSATATVGKPLGMVLQTVTIASGTALVWCRVGLL